MKEEEGKVVNMGGAQGPMHGSVEQVPAQESIPFEKAKRRMDMGFPIARTGWGGFWFSNGKETLVFTREGEFFDTPDDSNTQHNDWHLMALDREDMIRFVKSLRLSLDTLLQLTVELQQSRELAIVKTELQFGFMWMGYTLGQLDAPNPYPKSFDPKSPVIEPHADKAKDLNVAFMEELASLDATGKVKLFRRKIAMYIEAYTWLIKQMIVGNPALEIKVKNPFVHVEGVVLEHLMNANLWCGQLLNNIRVASENK
jgi:hypothetical protein